MNFYSSCSKLSTCISKLISMTIILIVLCTLIVAWRNNTKTTISQTKNIFPLILIWDQFFNSTKDPKTWQKIWTMQRIKSTYCYNSKAEIFTYEVNISIFEIKLLVSFFWNRIWDIWMMRNVYSKSKLNKISFLHKIVLLQTFISNCLFSIYILYQQLFKNIM